MERNHFLIRLLNATDRAIARARERVVNPLPEAVRYRLWLNRSYDGNPLADGEQVFPNEHPISDPVLRNAQEVIARLWRHGKVPEWINLNVDFADDQFTIVRLTCCGRFISSDDLLYHQQEGFPPFHAQGPDFRRYGPHDPSSERIDLLLRYKIKEQERALVYPEVVKHGSLRRFLNFEFAKIDVSLKVQDLDQAGNFEVGATVTNDRRVVDVSLTAQQRLFSVTFSNQGVQLAKLQTDDTGVLVKTTQAWCVDCRNPGALTSFAPGLDFDAERAAAFEAGPEAFTRHRWQSLLKAGMDVPQNKRLLPLLQETSRTPELSRLCPYVHTFWLGFSRCTGRPFSRDYPLIFPINDVGTFFQVIGGSGEAVGNGDVREAVALAVQHLPPGRGPAVHGTADDLKGPGEL